MGWIPKETLKICPSCNKSLLRYRFIRDVNVSSFVCSICNYCHMEKVRIAKEKYEIKRKIQVAKQRADEVKAGIRKKCANCDRLVLVEKLSKNGVCSIHINIAKIFGVIEADNISYHSARDVTELIIKQKRETPLEEQAKKAEELQDMVAQFLANKNT